ncbi:Alkane hydroxylase MAH1-like protein [Cladobotryum mycophilum]|uniref:Alkane hydroxylase MAH1-like protein n=1 Tax=Cladobotryum mycophilum TaxID=491253 RepID=A0ABR0SSU4_9HYPO
MGLALSTKDCQIGKTVVDLQAVFLEIYDTVAQTLTWTFYLLMKHRHATARIRQAIEGVLLDEGKNKTSTLRPEYFAPIDLPYIPSIFYKAHRLYSPNAIRDEASSARHHLSGQHSSSVRVWCTWAMNCSKLTWENSADEFYPERWLTDDDKAVIHKTSSEFPVFDGGSHLCLGKKMAEHIAVQVITTLVEIFDFTLAYAGERASKDI